MITSKKTTEQLETELKLTESVLRDKTKACEVLASQVAKLQSTVYELNKENDQLVNDYNVAVDTVNQLNQSLDSGKHQAGGEFERKHSEAMANLAILEVKLNQANEELAGVKAALDSSRNRLSRESAKVQQLESRNEKLDQENERLSVECAESALEIIELTKDKNVATENARLLQIELDGEPKRRANYLKVESEKLKAENSQHSQLAQSLKAEVKQLRQQNSALQSENEGLKAFITEQAQAAQYLKERTTEVLKDAAVVTKENSALIKQIDRLHEFNRFSEADVQYFYNESLAEFAESQRLREMLGWYSRTKHLYLEGVGIVYFLSNGTNAVERAQELGAKHPLFLFVSTLEGQNPIFYYAAGDIQFMSEENVFDFGENKQKVIDFITEFTSQEIDDRVQTMLQASYLYAEKIAQEDGVPLKYEDRIEKVVQRLPELMTAETTMDTTWLQGALSAMSKGKDGRRGEEGRQTMFTMNAALLNIYQREMRIIRGAEFDYVASKIKKSNKGKSKKPILPRVKLSPVEKRQLSQYLEQSCLKDKPLLTTEMRDRGGY